MKTKALYPGFVALCFVMCSNQPELDPNLALQAETMRTKWVKTGIVEVKARFTNRTRKTITLAQVMCILQNRKGEDIGVANNFVVKPNQKGLARGESKKFTFVVYGDYANTSTVVYDVKQLKFD